MNAFQPNNGYLYTWAQKIPGVKSADVALHLLEGEPSLECLSSAKSASSVQKLPDFYLKPDPGFWTNLTKRISVAFWTNLTRRISVAGLKPFKLHLYCNYEDGSENKHEVQGQPGRTITLPLNSRYDLSRLAPAIKFLWSKLGPGVDVDTVIDAVFKSSDIHTVDRKRLKGLQKTSETPMETLRDYIDCTGSLEQIVKDFDEKFCKDFELQKMRYRSSRVGWYCDEHFDTAFKQEEWKH